MQVNGLSTGRWRSKAGPGFYRELLSVEEFGSLTEARVIVEAWRVEYNTYRPHSALGNLTPSEYRAGWVAQHHNGRTHDPSPALETALRPS